MKDIAERAGVTKATVSMVMRNRAGISQATRERVMKIAREMDYRPGGHRQAKGDVYHGQIAFLVADNQSPLLGQSQPGESYLHRMLNGCVSESNEWGSGVLPCRMTNEEIEREQWPAVLQRGQLDGVVARCWLVPAAKRMLQSLEVPVVLVDCDQLDPDYSQVQIDSIHAMECVVEHLLGQGSRRLAVITGDLGHINGRERLAGVQMAAIRHGLSVPEDAVAMEQGFNEASGRRGMETLLSRGLDFDAVVCHSDLIALGAMEILAKAGRKVPDDVRVVGFDNMEFTERIHPSLTTVDPRSCELGVMAARLLQQKIQNKHDHPLSIRSSAALIVRESA